MHTAHHTSHITHHTRRQHSAQTPPQTFTNPPPSGRCLDHARHWPHPQTNHEGGGDHGPPPPTARRPPVDWRLRPLPRYRGEKEDEEEAGPDAPSRPVPGRLWRGGGGHLPPLRRVRLGAPGRERPPSPSGGELRAGGAAVEPHPLQGPQGRGATVGGPDRGRCHARARRGGGDPPGQVRPPRDGGGGGGGRGGGGGGGGGGGRARRGGGSAFREPRTC